MLNAAIRHRGGAGNALPFCSPVSFFFSNSQKAVFCPKVRETLKNHAHILSIALPQGQKSGRLLARGGTSSLGLPKPFLFCFKYCQLNTLKTINPSLSHFRLFRNVTLWLGPRSFETRRSPRAPHQYSWFSETSAVRPPGLPPLANTSPRVLSKMHILTLRGPGRGQDVNPSHWRMRMEKPHTHA